MSKVTILGGGVIGLCSAYYLKQEGHDVTVIERNDITDGCSFGNMGYISPSHFIPLATPGIIRQGLKWMLSSSSPFYIKPRMNLDLVRWGMAFKRSATAGHVARSAPHLNNLLQLSRELTVALKTELPDSFDLTEEGCWMLYKNASTGEHEKHLAEQAHAFGLRTVFCTPQQVQEYEKVEVDVAGGVLYLEDSHVNPRKLMRALFTSLQQSGVKFWLNTEVTGFEKENGRITKIITPKAELDCEELVIANGSWVGNISKLLGIRMLMQPGKGYSIEYNGLEKNLQHAAILVDHRTATTPIGNWLRIGGTMELSGHSENILPKRVTAVYDAFKKYYPGFFLPEPDTEKAWFGYRPVTPDGMPYIGRHSRYANLVYAGGHAMLGVSAAAATGRLIEEIIGHKPASIPLEAFRPERFS